MRAPELCCRDVNNDALALRAFLCYGGRVMQNYSEA